MNLARLFLLLLFSIYFFLACEADTHFTSFSGSSSEEKIPVVEDIPHEVLPPVERGNVFVERPLKEKAISSQKEPPTPDRELVITLKAEKKRVDMLVVLDTSGSMEHHLGKLGNRVFSLLDSILDHDWQMAFTTADHGDHKITKMRSRESIAFLPEARWQDHVNAPKASFGKLMQLEAAPIQLKGSELRKFATQLMKNPSPSFDLYNGWKLEKLDQRILTPEIPGYEEIFLSTVSYFPTKRCNWQPFCQKGLEQPLRSLKSAMERVEVDNGELFRPDTDFVSLIIANEEERAEDPERATSAQEVVDTFNTFLKPLGKRFFAFNILVLDEECRDQERKRGGKKTETVSIGVEISKLASLTVGDSGNISICEEDYGPALENISAVIESFVEQSVDLPDPYVPGTLEVEFLDGEAIPWKPSGNRLIFERTPPKDTKIKISYRPLD